MPKVSIILPVYNGQEYIAATIEMLCDTSMKEIEIIIVDDGSKDDSYKICCAYAEKDKRIKLFKKKNEGGVFAARNFGLEKAKGEYICFCDQDDVIEKEMYMKMYSNTMNGNVDVVMCSIGKYCDGKKEPYENLFDEYLSTEESRIKLLLENLFLNTKIYFNSKRKNGNFIWNCMIKKRFIDNNELVFRRFINSEDDWLFKLDILARAKTIVTMSDILYYWRVNLNSETYTSKYVENMYNKNKMLQDEIEKIAQIGGVKEEDILLYRKHFNCTRYINLLENEQKRLSLSFKEKIDSIKIIKEEKDFKQNLSIRKYYKIILIRKKIALALLNLNLIECAYLFLVLFHKFKLRGVKTIFWTKFEKKLGEN